MDEKEKKVFGWIESAQMQRPWLERPWLEKRVFLMDGLWLEKRVFRTDGEGGGAGGGGGVTRFRVGKDYL
jgi:hypothetical protein